jgi:hypothetical protein
LVTLTIAQHGNSVLISIYKFVGHSLLRVCTAGSVWIL